MSSCMLWAAGMPSFWRKLSTAPNSARQTQLCAARRGGVPCHVLGLCSRCDWGRRDTLLGTVHKCRQPQPPKPAWCPECRVRRTRRVSS
eukprot:261298-Chlamydomonas_euryale.AAC.1